MLRVLCMVHVYVDKAFRNNLNFDEYESIFVPRAYNYNII